MDILKLCGGKWVILDCGMLIFFYGEKSFYNIFMEY